MYVRALVCFGWSSFSHHVTSVSRSRDRYMLDYTQLVLHTARTMMATFSIVLFVVSLSSCLLSTTTAVSQAERSRWGNVRPARVLDINDTIYVHMVPHTHDDVGWLKTVDEYYYGGI